MTSKFPFITFCFLFLCGISTSNLYPATRAAEDTAALADMEALSSALAMCEIDTGYYVSLETLNDIGMSANPVYDSLNYEGGTYVIRPDEGLFRNERVDLLTAFNPWFGPYITYQPGTVQEGTQPYDQGSPIDPWGHPYLFYSPLGLLLGDTGNVTIEYHGDQFDRYTIASLGWDSVMSEDDLFRQFGSGITSVRISSIVGSFAWYSEPEFLAVAGSLIAIRGYNLATKAGEGTVFFGALELSDIVTWGNNQIDLILPEGLEGNAPVTVEIGASTSNPLTLEILPPITSATHWQLYQ